jgi:hypothetical protein
LTPIGVTPTNEAQCRPLTKLEPGQQIEAWQAVLDKAARRAGELLAGMEKHKGRPKKGSHGATVLSDTGINKTQSSRWQRIAAIPDERNEMTETEATTRRWSDAGGVGRYGYDPEDLKPAAGQPTNSRIERPTDFA